MSAVSIYLLSFKDIEYKKLLLGSTLKWERGHPNNHLSTIVSNEMSIVMDDHYGGDSITDLDSHTNMVVFGNHATFFF